MRIGWLTFCWTVIMAMAYAAGVAEPAQRDRKGLGEHIVQRVIVQAVQVRIIRGDEVITPTNVLKAVSTYDRVIVLLAKDTGRFPGALRQDTTAEYVLATGVSASKVTTFVVQPGPNGHGLMGLDERTIAFLAEHIVQEMACR